MKRFLAILLTFAMVLSLLPTAFSAEVASTGEKSGIVVKYDFTKYEGMPTEKSTSSTVKAAVPYEQTNGFWEYNRVNEVNMVTRVLSNGTPLVQFTPVTDITNSASSETPDKFFFAMHVNVPASGWYAS